MNQNNLFLSAYDQGITRAERGRDGEWTISHIARKHHVNCLAVDPSNPQKLYAGTRDGVLISEDAGLTWQARGMGGQIVKAITVSPHDPDTIYAGTKPALMFKSKDGGKSWKELESFRRIPNRWWWFSPAEPPGIRPYIIDIALSPTDPDLLLAGIEFGAVVRSEDGGQTWSRHLRGSLRDCHALKFHATNDWAYEAGGSGGGASFSRDGGRTWQKAGKGLAKHYGIICAADPVKPEIWYVCAGSSPFNAFGDNPAVYLYRSNGGAGWHPIGWEAHPLTATPTALVTVPGTPGQLYAGLKNGDVWHTADYGDTWQKMPFNLKAIWFSLLVP